MTKHNRKSTHIRYNFNEVDSSTEKAVLQIKEIIKKGYTLIELMLTIAIIAVVITLSVPTYQAYIERTQNDQAIKDIVVIQLQINAHALNNDGEYPMSLSELGLSGYQDPWGNNYRYYNIAQTGNIGPARKDRNLVPINSDYDLYSMGADGRTAPAFTSALSHDDIVRGNNGGFLGLAEDY